MQIPARDAAGASVFAHLERAFSHALLKGSRDADWEWTKQKKRRRDKRPL